MDPEIYSLLAEILNELKQDKKAIEEKKQKNLCYIKEAEVYADTYLGSEPEEDFKIFSPRNKDSEQQKEIKNIYGKKFQYEEENRQYAQKIDKLSSRIERIEIILDNNDNNYDSFTILSMQEEDRKRIARDLHDTSLQNLTHLIHQIELIGLYIDEDPIRAKLELTVIRKRIKEIIEEIRNTVFDIRPMIFDDLGLKAALERLVDSFNEDKKYEIILKIEDVSCETNIILVSIYRIVQECLNNIDKHADATLICIKCKCKENVCYISISDNGKGFIKSSDYGKNHFGIFSIKERIKLLGGRIRFDTVPEKGTCILICIPLDSCSN